jgi:hypothetical protein
MGVAGDVNILMVVTRVRLDRRYFAQRMAVASDVNIRTVVERVLVDQLCFAKYMEAGRRVRPSLDVARW